MNRKWVLITGASSGIGLATAKVLTKAGIDVFAGVRRQMDGEAVIEACVGGAGDVHPVILDVTDRPSIARAQEQIRKVLGGENLFGLINNAGIGYGGPLLLQPVDEFARILEVNLIGLLAVTQAFAPFLGARPDATGTPGRIVNISSVGGKIAAPFLGGYVSSKHALEGFSDSLRRELTPYGVDVIIVAPGAVQTKIWDKAEQHDFSYLIGTDYEASAKRFTDYFIKSGRLGFPAEKLGQIILTALTAEKPKARYAVVKNPLANWIIPRLLPKRMMDGIITRQLGLTRKPEKPSVTTPA